MTTAPLDSDASGGNGLAAESQPPRVGPAPLVVGPLTRTDLVRYQGASGDFNPIHHDEGFARDAGLPAPLSLGMLQAGMLATWATDWLGAEAIRRFRVRFAERVFPGDTLTCAGEIVREYRDGDEDVVDIELSCTTQNGAVAVLGWATFLREHTAMDSTAMDSTAMDSTAMDSTAMDSTAMDNTVMDNTVMDSNHDGKRP